MGQARILCGLEPLRLWELDEEVKNINWKTLYGAGDRVLPTATLADCSKDTGWSGVCVLAVDLGFTGNPAT